MNAAEQAQVMADYYDGYPKPPVEPATATDRALYQQQKHEWEQNFAPDQPPPAPSPPDVPGPPGPGAGMPAARAGDLTNHGATIGPVTTGLVASVLIGNKPAACQGDPHICPMVVGAKAHVGGTIMRGSRTVEIGYKPAARVSDTTQCTAEPGSIATGELTVEIGDLGGNGSGAVLPESTAATEAESAESSATDQGDQQKQGGSNAHGNNRAGSGNESGSDTRQPGESIRKAGTGTHWVRVELVDESEAPVPAERYCITLPDRKKVKGHLDAAGSVRVEGIEQPGWCGIEFPDLDLAAWQRWTPGPASKTAAGSTAVGTDQPCGPVGAGGLPARRGKWHTVRQGECTSSIAVDSGHFWRTLWIHPQNSELAKLRGNPNALLPGDGIFVPERRPRTETGATDKDHKFKRLGEPSWLNLTLLDDGQPRGNEDYVLEIDGKKRQGTTDAQGRLHEPIPGNARRAVLRIGSDVFRLNVGHTDPVNEISGVQARLNNLGFGCGPVNGELNERTVSALNLFRQYVDLPASQTMDAATVRKLEEVHDRMNAATYLYDDDQPDEDESPADMDDGQFDDDDSDTPDPFYDDIDE